MRALKIGLSVILVLQFLFVACPSDAMNLTHYDLYSLVYMSTDIVIATLSEDSQHSFTATVTETLYGSLHTNDRLDKLTPFLTFFSPMESGMKVILFLDRRPHKYDFLNSEAAKSPFAIPPSGVYLIDAYDHVHEYFQQMNPGPYVAQNYSLLYKPFTPTKEQDLALPSLAEVKARIAAAIKTVQPVRGVLDKVATREDAPALMTLLDVTSINEKDCALRMAWGIRERAIEQMRSLDDPALMLKAYSSAGIANAMLYAYSFARPTQQTDAAYADARVTFLIHSLADHKEDVALRVAALQILLNLSTFHSKPQNGRFGPLPIDNEWMANHADEIQTTSKAIFDDASQNPQLRGLCVRFLDLDRPEILSDVRRVYGGAKSVELQFAIERTLLDASDARFESLHPASGPVASRIIPSQECACVKKDRKETVFLMQYQVRRDFRAQDLENSIPHIALTNLQTGQHFTFTPNDVQMLDGWIGQWDGQSQFQLGALTRVPAGDYSLALECSTGDKIISNGYGLDVSIRETPAGKEVSVRTAPEQ